MNTTTFRKTLPLWLLIGSFIVLSSGEDYSTIEEKPFRLTVAHKLVLLPLASFLGIYSLLITCKYKSWPKPAKPVCLYVLYLLINIVFLPFSQNIGYSAWKLFETTTSVLVVYAMVCTVGARRTLTILLMGILAMICFVWLGVLLSPSKGLMLDKYANHYIPFNLHGYLIGLNSNSIGLLSAVLLFSFPLIPLRQNISLRNLWKLGLFITLFLAQSRTAWIALGFGYFGTIADRTHRHTIFVFLLMGIMLMALVPPDALLSVATRGKGLDSALTHSLSGRTDLWSYAVENSDRFWKCGLGFAAGSRSLLETYGMGETASLHGDLADAFTGSGFLGAAALLACMASVLLFLVRAGNDSNYISCSKGFLIALMIRSFTGTTLAFGNLYPALFTSIVFELDAVTNPR
ncbi:MAG: hypothetical protein JW828_02305 [Sedimentisphaerales bacterium]|nr:hypothetical protein [Sedimentisphaerales bacterium]